MSRPLGILWVCGSNVVGGAERVTLQICELLRQRGHRTTGLFARGSPLLSAGRRAGFPANPAPLGRELDPRAVLALRHTLASTSSDIMLVTTSSEWMSACLARQPASPTRLVLVRHMALPLSLPVRRLAGSRADAVVAVSEAVRQQLVARRGIRSEQVHVILNPVRIPPRTSPPTAAERRCARIALGLPAEGRWVGFFGGLRRGKGLADALRAVEFAQQRLGQTRLLICGGRGDDRAARSLGKMIDALHRAGRVVDLGEIEDMTKAFTAVDVVLMPTRSTLSEALPATLIEAMACGTSVIGYATGGITEVIGPDGQSGRLARPDDVEDLARVLAEVLANPDAARNMVAVGLTRVRQLFDPQRAVDAYEELFVRLR